jgi:hypothetical protein
MNNIADLPSASPPPQTRTKKPQPGIGGLINLALMVWMIWDLRRRRDEEINGRRKLWLLAAFAPPIGPIAYFIFGRKRKIQQEIPLSAVDSGPQADVTPIQQPHGGEPVKGPADSSPQSG